MLFYRKKEISIIFFFHLFVFLHILIINLSVCCHFRLLFFAFSASNNYLWFSDVTLDEFLIGKLKNQRPICAKFASILWDIISPLFIFTFGHIFSKCYEILVDILVILFLLQKMSTVNTFETYFFYKCI